MRKPFVPHLSYVIGHLHFSITTPMRRSSYGSVFINVLALDRLALSEGDSERTTTALGACCTIIEWLKPEIAPYSKHDYEQAMSTTKAALDAACWEGAWARGPRHVVGRGAGLRAGGAELEPWSEVRDSVITAP